MCWFGVLRLEPNSQFELRLRGGPAPGGDQPKEAETQAVEPRVGAAVADAEAAAHGRSSRAGEPVAEGEQPDSDGAERDGGALRERGGGELRAQGAGGGAEREAEVIERDRQVLLLVLHARFGHRAVVSDLELLRERAMELDAPGPAADC